MTFFGADLCGTVTAAVPAAAAVPWPFKVARCRVLLDGALIPIQIAFTLTDGASQINAQLPFGIAAATHTLQVQRVFGKSR